MTRAVKAVSTYRGRDPRDFTLCAFGGNGPVVAARSPMSSRSAASSSLRRRACSVPPAFSTTPSEYHFARSPRRNPSRRPAPSSATLYDEPRGAGSRCDGGRRRGRW